MRRAGRRSARLGRLAHLLALAAFVTPLDARADDRPLWQIMGYGQSLSVGVLGVPALSTASSPHAVMFAEGIRPPLGAAPRLDALVPLAEADDRNRGETGIAAAAETFVQTLARLRGVAVDQLDMTMLGATAGRAGARLTALMPGSINYTRLMERVTAGETLGQSGRGYRYLATLWSHGETDQRAGTPRARYAADLAALATTISRDVRHITGQSWVPPLLAYQPASHLAYLARGRPETPARPEIALALREAARSADPASEATIYCVLPLYFGAFRDGIHATNQTYRDIGRYFGRALAKLVHARETAQPVPPLALDLEDARWASRSVTLRFAVPRGPLAFDAQALPPAPHMGFDLWSPEGQLLPDAIVDVSIVSGEEVRVSFRAEPAPGSRLSYAFGRPEDPFDPKTPPHGNLRDSEGAEDASKLNAGLRRLDNWALIFETAKP
ncbi:hypothetical protein AncyloWKF20_01340 [Ancylobacter sp. WKF20]|uniref:hypothetical protein n=1 Tax=Ancylobacter sp. WKF20 TaxID=3039801 RepID=UPI0024341EFD|nr:hypothetical protein [Ancylobacter sp. WKF20]WGD30515.1 hypothetical protein AncyloWKF20_01340 [Ancylobacter sp. WKF20]